MWYGTALGTKSGMKTFNEIFKFSDSKEGKFRLKVIEHFAEYDLSSAMSAYGVPKTTLYRWRRIYLGSKNNLTALLPKSRKPNHVRTMQTDWRIIRFIKEQRQAHYRLGKEKIKPLLDKFCKENGLRSVSETTIGKIIKRWNFFFQKKERIYHDPGRKSQEYRIKRVRVKKSPRENIPGYYEIDTIERMSGKGKIYIFNAVDVCTRFEFAYAYRNGNSINARDFYEKLEYISPCKIRKIQTDNGAEYAGKFEEHLRQIQQKHIHTYPRCPKINGYVERANRSLDEEFIVSNLYRYDADFCLDEFNSKLMEHLIWYNSERVHKSLGNITPLAFVLNNSQKSHMYATHTYT